MASRTLLSLPTLTCSGRSATGLVAQPAQVQREQEALLQLERHVGELGLGELEAADRPAELLAGRRVRQRGLQAVAGRAQRAPDDAESGLGQAGERRLEPGARRGSRAESGTRTSSSVISPVLDARSDILCLISRAVKPGVSVGTAKPATPSVGTRPDHRHVGDRRVGDPHLAAVEHPVGAVAAGPGRHVGRVGAVVGLGQAEAADQLAGRHARQPSLLLLLASRTSRWRTSPASPAR